MSPQPHTRDSLGVPDWFFCDGCSSAPDLPWLSIACDAHDWDYWRGVLGGKTRQEADRDFRARIKHNAKFSPGSWFDRLWRPPMGEVYFVAVMKFSEKAFRTRRNSDLLQYRLPDGSLDWETLAVAENKHANYLR